MKRLSRVASGSWGRVIELWERGSITDVLMSVGVIGVYDGGELVHAERLGEEEVYAFVDETIPADYEQVWREEVRKGGLFKYSFLLSEEVLVRCLLWNLGLSLRFIPVGERVEELVGEDVLRLVDSSRFFIVHSGKVGSGKTTRIVGQVRRLLKDPDAKVFVYSQPQEVYVGDGRGVMVQVSSSSMRFSDFLELVSRSRGSVVVVQSALSKEDWENLRLVFERGINVIMEVGAYGREYLSLLPEGALEVKNGTILKRR